MTLPNYQLVLIDCVTGLTKLVLDPASLYDLKFSRVLNDVGVLAVTLPSKPAIRSLCTLDTFVEVYRTNPATQKLNLEETYLARLFHRFRVDNDERFILGGVSLNHLLTRRLVNPVDDPAQAGGYSTKAGAADTVIRAYAMEQVGSSASALRRVPGLSIDPVAGTGSAVGARLRYEELLTAMQDLAQRGNTDFIIKRGLGAALTLTIAPIGQDRTKTTNYPWGPFTQIDPLRGNLQKPSYQVDRRGEKNYVYAQSQGQGLNRTTLNLLGNTTADSPFNLIEFQHDARNVQQADAAGLMTAARVVLRDNLPQMEFSFEPMGVLPGNTYHLDWDVGDRITARWDEVSQDLRITQVEVTVADQGEQVKVTLTRYDT